ncbi:hypothetical protein Q31b_18580 [Novipirellula aureliae]|uniref:Methanolan biosynthesis EpsI domain-containing protein n=1 Tax=Novipirellula aureliae TaxID=2527966 RepID=A0A5C6E5X8_9BACT|nr:exosortase-associated EpsI family protein [Novipirellula aureliae]TWU44322.1 hypothetical protein Q31b_18580 [Novipirellula aureliae]
MKSAKTESKSSVFKTYRMIPFVVVITFVLLSGVAHGVLDGRWSEPKDLIQQGDRLNQLPDHCGDWTLLHRDELDDGAKKLLRCYGSSLAVYQHDRTKSTVTVAVLFGPRGPIAVHTPEICYSSVGTKQVGETKKQIIQTPSGQQEFFSVQFAIAPSTEPSLDVWYAWSEGDAWIAAEYPRLWMAHSLYKIQVAGSVEVSENDCNNFLTSFLPEIDALLE